MFEWDFIHGSIPGFTQAGCLNGLIPCALDASTTLVDSPPVRRAQSAAGSLLDHAQV